MMVLSPSDEENDEKERDEYAFLNLLGAGGIAFARRANRTHDLIIDIYNTPLRLATTYIGRQARFGTTLLTSPVDCLY